MDLHGRAAFVTGGSGDLGAAACEALARAGCDVAVGYVGNRDGAAKTARLVEGLGRRACAEIWDRIFDTNVRGPFQLARAAAAHMKKTGAGRIVNVASVAGLKPDGSSIAYAASKAALIHLTRCLAVALAPSITVNCVAPGLIEGTRMAQRLPQPVTERARVRRRCSAAPPAPSRS
jgi:3-oxoacyl-[acyl-carrier protein] reductase